MTTRAVEKPEAEEVQGYYRDIQPWFDLELADRGDGDFWRQAVRQAMRETARPGEAAGPRVLEVGAGTGRATAFLCPEARQVVAFDLAPGMIAAARPRLCHCDRVHLFAADMRELRLAARFDLVVAVDDPFVHLTASADRDRALARVAEHLAPGGCFLLDAAWLSPRKRRAATRNRDGLNLTKRVPGSRGDDRDGGHELEVRERWRCEPESRCCEVRFEYLVDGREVQRATFAGRLWSRAELGHRFARAGLKLVTLWGDYDRTPWDRETSPRLIAAARLAGR